MTRSPGALPTVLTVTEARKAQFTHAQIERRVARGQWRPLLRGVYCSASLYEQANPADQWALMGIAAARTRGGRPVVSHTSAAGLYRLPIPRGSASGWVTVAPPGTTRRRPGLVVEVASLPAQDVAAVRGVTVTSPARTVADCLRHLDMGDAVAIADAALHRGLASEPEVLQVLERCEGWPYAGRARDRLPLVDGRRESPAESASFVALWHLDLPLPEPQVRLFASDGTFVARLDGWWAGRCVAAEVDGLVKYGVDSRMSEGEVRAALVAEKRREDAIRRTGAGVVRWGVRDLQRPGFADEVRQALADGRPDRFTGRVVCTPRRTLAMVA